MSGTPPPEDPLLAWLDAPAHPDTYVTGSILAALHELHTAVAALTFQRKTVMGVTVTRVVSNGAVFDRAFRAQTLARDVLAQNGCWPHLSGGKR